MLDCKHALEEAGGEFEKAKEILRRKGHALAAKRAERATAEGVVLSYLHHDGRLGSLVEVNCESDFVARTEDFQQLAQSIAIQVAATNPQDGREHPRTALRALRTGALSDGGRRPQTGSPAAQRRSPHGRPPLRDRSRHARYDRRAAEGGPEHGD